MIEACSLATWRFEYEVSPTGRLPVALDAVLPKANSSAVSFHRKATLSSPDRPRMSPLSPTGAAIVPDANPRPTTESFTSRFVVLTVANVPFTVRSPATTTFCTLRVSVSLLKVNVESPPKVPPSLNWTPFEVAAGATVDAIVTAPFDSVVSEMPAPARR